MSAGPGWIGHPEHLLHVLSIVGADKDDEGNFLVYGEPVVTGLTVEVLVPTGAEYSVQGTRANLASLLTQTSYGSKVTVIA